MAVAQGTQATESINHMKGAMTYEDGQAIASRDAMIQVLHQRLGILAADANKREEDILRIHS